MIYEVETNIYQHKAIEKAVENVRSTADGKNTVFFQPAAPSATDRKVNDIWFDTDDGNKMYYWDGTAWTAKQFDSAAIAAEAITAAHILAGAITTAKIAAEGIEADVIKGGTLTLGGSNNINGKLVIKNAHAEETGGWDKDGITIPVYRSVTMALPSGNDTAHVEDIRMNEDGFWIDVIPFTIEDGSGTVIWEETETGVFGFFSKNYDPMFTNMFPWYTANHMRMEMGNVGAIVSAGEFAVYAKGIDPTGESALVDEDDYYISFDFKLNQCEFNVPILAHALSATAVQAVSVKTDEGVYGPYIQATGTASSEISGVNATKVTLAEDPNNPPSFYMPNNDFTITNGGVMVNKAGRYRVTGSVNITPGAANNFSGVYVCKGSVGSTILSALQYNGTTRTRELQCGPKIVDLAAGDMLYLCSRSAGTAGSHAPNHESTYLLIERIS